MRRPDPRTISLALPALAALLVLGTTPAASSATAEEPTAEQRRICVDVARVNGWSVIDSRSIELQVGAKDRYLVELGVIAETAGLRSSSRIGIVPNSAGELCRVGGRILADGRRVPVESIRKLPPRGTDAAATP